MSEFNIPKGAVLIEEEAVFSDSKNADGIDIVEVKTAQVIYAGAYENLAQFQEKPPKPNWFYDQSLRLHYYEEWCDSSKRWKRVYPERPELYTSKVSGGVQGGNGHSSFQVNPRGREEKEE